MTALTVTTEVPSDAGAHARPSTSHDPRLSARPNPIPNPIHNPIPNHGPNAMLPRLYMVHSVRQETVDTWTLEIKPSEGGRCRPFLPGQFNMLYEFGVGEVAISISGDPSWPGSYVHT